MSRTPGSLILRRALAAAAGRPASSAAIRRVSKAAITRRGLLKGGVAAMLAAGVAGRLPLPARAAGLRVAVVGAGMAGLSAAWHLAEAGADVTVLERGARVGGRVFSAPATFAPELVVDLGGAFINTDHADMLSLVEAMGLSLFDRAVADVAGVEPDGFLIGGRPFAEAEVAKAFAPLAAAIAKDAARLDADWDANAAAIDSQSVADYLDAHFAGAPGWARTLADGVIRSEYGVEPAEASALELIWLMPTVDGEAVELLSTSDETYNVVGGSGSVPVALAERLGKRVRTGVAIEAIADHGDSERVAITTGDGTVERFDRAIIAVPLPALRKIRLEAELPAGFREMVAQGRLGHDEKVMIGFEGRPWLAAKAFSNSAWVGDPCTAVWNATKRQTEAAKAALTFFIGGDQATTALADKTAEAQRQDFLDVFATSIAGLREAALPGVIRTDWGRQVGGAYTNFAPGFFTRFVQFFWSEPDDGSPAIGPVFGNLAFAGEHLSEDFVGFMNGAAQTGRLAAAAVAT